MPEVPAPEKNPAGSDKNQSDEGRTNNLQGRFFQTTRSKTDLYWRRFWAKATKRGPGDFAPDPLIRAEIRSAISVAALVLETVYSRRDGPEIAHPCLCESRRSLFCIHQQFLWIFDQPRV